MAKQINKMLKAELVNYISVNGDMETDGLGDMLKKDLVKLG
jgi:hypothetical protein